MARCPKCIRRVRRNKRTKVLKCPRCGFLPDAIGKAMRKAEAAALAIAQAITSPPEPESA